MSASAVTSARSIPPRIFNRARWENSSVARLLRKARRLERRARGRKGFQHGIQQDERAAEAQRRTGEEAAGHAGPTGPEASRRGARPQPGSNPPRGRPASEEGRGRRARGRRLSGFMEGAKLRLGGLTMKKKKTQARSRYGEKASEK